MEEKKVVVELERYLWPDQIKERRKKRIRKIVKNTLATILISLVAALSIYGGYNLINNPRVKTTSDELKFQAIIDILEDNWYFGKNFENLNQAIYDQALNSVSTFEIDPHTSYMNAEEAAKFNEQLSGTFVGIGVQFYDLDGNFVVDKVFKSSPAEKSGMLAGDIIVKVDGQDVTGLTSTELATLVKGEQGSDVKIEVIRGIDNIEFTINRQPIANSVHGYELADIGVVEMDSFALTSPTELEAYFKEFKEDGINDLIIDLRNNGGGYLDVTVDIVSMLLGPDKIVLQKLDKEGNIEEIKTKRSDIYEFDNIVVLINEYTASASEVLTAALANYLDIEVVGVNSYGKGTMQTSIGFADGSSLKYTIGEWLTPSGDKINQIGIKPDVEVELDRAITIDLPTKFEGSYKVDSVGYPVEVMQVYLEFLGYNPGRSDGYFSQQTLDAYLAYQADRNFLITEELDFDNIKTLVSECSKTWSLERETRDTQLLEGVEILNGRT